MTRKHAEEWVEHFEERFLGKKEMKKERKRLQRTDRSFWKDFDFETLTEGISFDKKVSGKSYPRGRVLRISGQEVIVECEGEQICCFLRGVFKKEKLPLASLVTVGDFVRFEKVSEREGVIHQIEPRKSLLTRKDPLSPRKFKLMAANIDQVLITGSVVNPPLKPPLIDRYIIATKKGRMDPVIVVNKVDLLSGHSEEEALLEEMRKGYLAAGIPFLTMSVKTKEGIEILKEVMKDKASVLSGQSGVGKTSLINVITDLSLPVKETVKRTKKGSHMTTQATLLPLEFGGFCIDTPGIRSFGFWELSREELESYFAEIEEAGRHCGFHNCTHTHEKACNVIESVEKGEISKLRYDSYCALLQSLDEEYLRR